MNDEKPWLDLDQLTQRLCVITAEQLGLDPAEVRPETQGKRITLGLAAPADVKILRGELNQKHAMAETTELVVEDGLLVAC